MSTKYTLNEISNCVSLDKLIKDTLDRLAELRIKNLAKKITNQEKLELAQLESILVNKKDYFEKMSCDKKIEYQRLVESGLLVSEQAIKSEESILKKNTYEQYAYIGIAGVVLLTGLYILLNKK